VADEPLWMVSAYDGKTHAFLGERRDFAEALCEHSVPSEKLRVGEAVRCFACLLIWGDMLAERGGDAAWRAG